MLVVAEAEKQEFESIDGKKMDLIENNKQELSNNTATTIKVANEDPWEFSKSQILYGSLMSNRKVSKLVNMKRSKIEENGRKLQYVSNSEIEKRDLKIQAQKNTTYWTVLGNTRGFFGFISLTLGLVLWTKIDTTLEPKLREDFGYSASIVSLFYTIQFVGYLVLSPFCHKILEKADGTLLTFLAFVVIGLSSFLIGPSELLAEFMTIPNSIYLIIPGLFLTGIATNFTTISTYGEMYEPFVDIYTKNGMPTYDNDKLGDILAGLYNGGYSIGVIIGPFSASYLMIWLSDSFRLQSDVFAVFTLFFAFILFFAVYIPKKYRTHV